MKGDPKVIERLNEALYLELAVVNQIWLNYRQLENWATPSSPRRSAPNRSTKCTMPTNSSHASSSSTDFRTCRAWRRSEKRYLITRYYYVIRCPLWQRLSRSTTH